MNPGKNKRSSKSSKNKKRNDAQTTAARRNIAGITFIGDKIWVSELTSIAFACALLVSLLSISFVILRNELDMQKSDREIAGLKAEKINAAHELEVMREKHRVRMLLNAVAGRRIQPAAIDRLSDLVYQNSRQFGYNPELLLAVMAVESKFNPDALGRYRSGQLSGALGLMQIKYGTALEVAKIVGIENLKRQDLMDPEINMILGTAYLTTLIARFNSFELGIMAYNLGPGAVRSALSRKGQVPMQYYERVLVQYYRLKEQSRELEKQENEG